MRPDELLFGANLDRMPHFGGIYDVRNDRAMGEGHRVSRLLDPVIVQKPSGNTTERNPSYDRRES